MCCSSWGHKESDMTQWLNCTDWMSITVPNLYIGILNQNVIVLGVGAHPSWMGFIPFKNRPQGDHIPLVPCECIDRRWLFIHQETGSHQIPNLLALWLGTCQPPEMQKISSNACLSFAFLLQHPRQTETQCMAGFKLWKNNLYPE